MILAIDIGNTNIVVGCIDDEKIYFIERLSTVRTKTELEYAIDLKTVLDIYHIKRTDIEGCIISSVVPQITNVAKLAAEKILKKRDRARKHHYNFYTHCDWGRAEHYSISLDSGLLGVPKCVELICCAAQ